MNTTKYTYNDIIIALKSPKPPTITFNKKDGEVMKTLIYNAIRTPDGTLLESHYRHDYRQHADTNGKIYMIDGGLEYIRCSDNGDEVSLAVYLEDGHDKVREVLKWGTRGKGGKQPLKWVALKDMESSHIEACLCTQPHMKHAYRISMENEITYREKLLN